VDGVAIGQGVVEPLERHEGAALGGHEAVGLGVEGPRPARPGHGVQRTESHMDEEVVGPVHGASQRHVGAAVVQPVAGQLDGVERAGAGRVEAGGAGLEAQGLGQQQRGQARVEAVARVGQVEAGLLHHAGAQRLREPRGLGQAGGGRGGEAQVAHHHGGAGPHGGGVEAGVAQGRAAGVQGPQKERVEGGEGRGGQAEALWVPHLLEAAHVAAPVGPRVVGLRLVGRRRHAGGIDPPPAVGGRRGEVTTREHGLPELLGGERAGQDAGAPDDGDRREDGHGVLVGARRRAAGGSRRPRAGPRARRSRRPSG